MAQIKTSSSISLVAGLYLMIASFSLGLGLSSVLFSAGLLVSILSLIELVSVESAKWVSWINGVLGLFLFLSPAFYAGMVAGAVWNSIILGIIIVALSAWSLASSSSTMGRGHPKMG